MLILFVWCAEMEYDRAAQKKTDWAKKNEREEKKRMIEDDFYSFVSFSMFAHRIYMPEYQWANFLNEKKQQRASEQERESENSDDIVAIFILL